MPDLKHALLVVAAGALLSGCATVYAPVPLESIGDSPRVQSQTQHDVTVSTTILTDDEARSQFGADLGAHGVQAMWLRVRNATWRNLWLIRNQIDPDLYSPDELALLLEPDVPAADFDRMRQSLRDQAMRLLLNPMTITEGFIYLPRIEGGRYLDIRLGADVYETAVDREAALSLPGGTWNDELAELRFGFAMPLPDGDFDFERMDTAHTYAGAVLPNLDGELLRAQLERLPCCVTNEDGTRDGDPLNLVFVGDSAAVLTALSRSGWSFTHRISLKTVQRLVGAALSGEAYPVAPVSSLYVFGRKQDFALQRARTDISRRNHMRLWLAPYLVEGRQVWIAQVSRDIGVKLTTESPTLTTHVIDPQVDLAREYVLHSLLAEGLVERFGFIRGARRASRDQPAQNLTSDPYFSDGLRLVVFIPNNPVPYAAIRSLLWDQADAPVKEGQSEAATGNVRDIR
ncbi:MAG: LssY C-terminal domain-containing protein [Chromatiales bacterium]|nr:LssY C-terminal domain-containing protein [Chromatiales bacterium]